MGWNEKKRKKERKKKKKREEEEVSPTTIELISIIEFASENEKVISSSLFLLEKKLTVHQTQE